MNIHKLILRVINNFIIPDVKNNTIDTCIYLL